MTHKNERPPQTYVIADTHFFHDRIIKYQHRPKFWEDVIIRNWNNTVREEDTIIVAGDFAFGHRDEIKNVVGKLQGNKILVLGNHDRFSKSFYKSVGFSFVCDRIDIGRFIITHKALQIDEIPNNKINIHGHIHNVSLGAKYYNASVDINNFVPVNLNNIAGNKCRRQYKKFGAALV